jgi:hypothetical protein
MNPRRIDTWYFIAWAVSLFTTALLLSSPVAAELGRFTGAFTSRLRVILCACWSGQPKNAARVNRTETGQTMVGHGPDMPMEVASSGTTDLDQLVMILLDAARPASVPAKFE